MGLRSSSEGEEGTAGPLETAFLMVMISEQKGRIHYILSEPPVGKMRVDAVRGLYKLCDSVTLAVLLLS